MRIRIALPYEGAETKTPIWAHEEEEIDFLKEAWRGERCSVAYAAEQLKHYLERSLVSAEIVYGTSGDRSGEYTINLSVTRRTPDAWGGFDTGFAIEADRAGVCIVGQERTGVLYGVYELLRWQGWRWFNPGLSGETVPEPRDELHIHEGTHHFEPSMNEGRGFDFEYVSMDSVNMFEWMARNRMNVTAYRPSTAALCRKLGMMFKVGGHVFESMLHPDRVLPGGGTIWDEHPEWFGLPANGKRTKEGAQRTQFCVSQQSSLDYVGAELLAWLKGKWKHADRVDVWGFDTWGQSCHCADCRKLGSSTDSIIHFMSALRKSVDEAARRHELDRPVRLITCGYEGTDTIAGPVGQFPESLHKAGDMVVFYPINRCYAHGIGDISCEINARYKGWLESWTASASKPRSLPIIAGEYYNVSRFEDLPLLFTKRIAEDLPEYYRMGVRGTTYMHVPMINWGMRTLTQVLYAQMAWDVGTDVEAFLDDYYANRYGPYAGSMRTVYGLVEEAWLHVADWRSWSSQSVLSLLNRWDGRKPEKALHSTLHLDTADRMSEFGRRSLIGLKEAERLLKEAHRSERRALALSAGRPPEAAVNPLEQRRLDAMGQYEPRLGEDRRSLRYGIDTLTLMVAFVEYHTALHRDSTDDAETAWRTIEATEEALDACYIPISYDNSGAGLNSKDALTRSQLKGLISRCRGARI